MTKVRWQPPAGFRRVANIPQQFSRGTVHIGIVTGIKRRNEPGAAAAVIGAYVDFRAPRQGFLKSSDAEKVAHGQRVRVEVERAYSDHEGQPRFDLKLIEVLPQEKPHAPKDLWAGFKRIDDWIVFPPEKAGDGLPGLYAKRLAHITKVENSGEILKVRGVDYHVMVPQGFTDAMESIYNKDVFELQLMSERRKFENSIMYLVCHPDFSDIALGEVEISGEYGFKIGDKVKLRDPLKGIKSFAEILELRVTIGKIGFLLVPPNIGAIYSQSLESTYVKRGKSVFHDDYLLVKIPTCLLLDQTEGRVEFVVIGVDEDDHSTGCPTMAYPVNCDAAIANVKALFEGAEAEIFFMSNYYAHGVEKWEGHDVRVDYNGSTFGGFLICDDSAGLFGQTIRCKIKFTQMGNFRDDKANLTRLLLQTPYFELID